MNMKFTQDSHLLSSLSNVTLNIYSMEREDLEFFTNSVHQNQNLYPNQKQFLINAIPENQQICIDTLFEQILAKCSTQTNASNEDNTIWIGEENIIGVSEQVQVIQKQQEPKFPLKKIKKRKSLYKSKTHKKQKRRQTNEQRMKRLQMEIKLRNQTKNIPKNYGKAILISILKNKNTTKHFTEQHGIEFEGFCKEIKEMKKQIKTIADLRSLWIDSQHASAIRILGNLFLRKHSLSYIFKSKISNTNAHVKYRHKLLEAIRDPGAFKQFKDC